MEIKMKKQMSIGNLNAIFIGEKTKLDLLDRWDEYVYLVFKEGYTYGKYPEYILKNIKIAKILKSGPAIMGRFVKNTVLKIEQILKSGELIQKKESHESAPSSFFIYLLKTHILIFLPENPGAPNVHSFKTFLEKTINKERLQYIRKTNKGKEKEDKLIVVESNPPVIISYIPIPMITSLDNQFKNIKKIKKIWVRHFYQNANLNVKSWIDGDNAVLQALKAPKIDHAITQVEDINATRDFVLDLAQANNASFTVEGIGETGSVVISNEGTQYINYNIPDYQSDEAVLSVAEKICRVYENDIRKGNIPGIPAKNDDAKMARVLKDEKK
jgi:macrodomain Ter protein organizer (MatP/YcbG family)